MAGTVRELESKLEKCKEGREAAKMTAFRLSQKVSEEEIKTTTVETDLKIEREWRQSLQEAAEREKNVVSSLQKKTVECSKLKEDYESLRSAHVQLISTIEDQERTLEELGVHLSESKLEIAEIKDVSKSWRDAQWAPDKEATNCNLCNKEFNIARRRHHCRHCGNIFCHSCSDNTMPLPSSARPVRVCDTCHTQLLQRYSNSH